jgi:hypothetical protein
MVGIMLKLLEHYRRETRAGLSLHETPVRLIVAVVVNDKLRLGWRWNGLGR